MSTGGNTRVARPAGRRGLLVGCIAVTVSLALTVLAALAVGTIVEWIGMRTWWRDAPVQHSQARVATDMAYLSGYPRSLLADDTAAFAARWAGLASTTAATIGLVGLIQRSQASTADVPAWMQRLPAAMRPTQSPLRAAAPYLLAAIYVWQDTLVRLAIVWLATPAFGIALLIGLVDGLGRRDIRRWCGGRESAFVYHHAKRMLWPAFTVAFFLYLVSPVSALNPAWLILPFCGVLAAAVSVTAATFKKYL